LIARVIAANPSVSVLGFIDDDPAKNRTLFCGYPVSGFDVLPNLDLSQVSFVNLISSDCAIRHETSRRLADSGCKFTSLIDPSVDMQGVFAGTGLYIQEGVHIQQSAVIEDNTTIHMAALVSHEARIGKSCFIAHAVSISGCVEIGDRVFVGTNASILPHRKIGEGAVIGAGSVVTKDVPEYTIVAGNPARVIREIEHAQ
jgi:sugar O-acyltransferase (sialic acid O-acetyltransferase NeuD family)